MATQRNGVVKVYRRDSVSTRIAKFVESLDVRVFLFACFIAGVFFMTLSRRVSDVCWFMAAIALIVMAMKRDWVRGSLDLQVVAFSIAVTASIIFSIDKGLTLRYLKKDVLRFLVIYFAGVQALRDEKNILWLCRVWLISVLITMLLGLGHYSKAHRLEGLFGASTRYGKYLDLIVPFAIAFFTVPGNLIHALLIGAAIIVAVYSVVLTMTRGAWIGISLGVFSFFAITKRWKWALVSILLVLTVFLISPSRNKIYHRFLSVINVRKTIKTDHSLKQRFAFYKTAIELIRERPMGWGYGRKIPRKIKKLKGEGWFKEKGLTPFTWHCHDSYLEIILETGFLGFAAFIWLMASAIFMCIKNMKNSDNTMRYTVSAGILCSLIALMTHGIWTNIFQMPLIFIVAMYLAMISSMARGDKVASKD